MSKPEPTNPPPPPRDWFVAAIECEGSVSACLASVLHELGRRTDFVAGLKASLELTSAKGVDAITDLGQKIKGLENTLRFRLGILRPERPAAWFRAPATTNNGPFSSTVLEEPVFAPYEASDVERVRAGLAEAWAARRAHGLPFKDVTGCLWRTLLGYSEMLERITTLPAPYAHLRLDGLPDGLPVELESRALRAFLINVRGEVLSTRDRLVSCHEQLLAASERLWSAQLEAETLRAARTTARETPRETPGGGRESARARPGSPADSVREEFRRRRAATDVRRLLTPADMQALRFMGFEDLPSATDLRQRYLTMARQLHPDLHGGSDTGFKTLTRAYEQLNERVG